IFNPQMNHRFFMMKATLMVGLAALQMFSALAQDTKVKPYLLTPKTTYDTQPTMCEATDGTVWTGYVGYHQPDGDAVMVVSKKDGKWSAPEQVNKTRTQIVRPTLAKFGDSVCALWTESGDKLARIMFSERKAGTWSDPVAISDAKYAAQNQEVAVAKDGKLAVVWQEFREGEYDIITKTLSEGNWSDAVNLTHDQYDDWDPAVVYDSHNQLWFAWTSFRDGDYDVFVKRADVPDAKEIRLGARGEYDLHVSMAADNDGRVWLVWDSVKVPRHGESGSMTITGANLKKRPTEQLNDPENPNQKPLVARVRMAVLDDGKFLTLPNTPKSLQPPDDYKLAHTAVPRISVDGSGTVWVAYRALSKPKQPSGTEEQPNPKANGKKGKAGGKKNKKADKVRGPYWWDVFVQSFRDGKWSAPEMMPSSDGNLEEVAMVPTSGGVQISYEMEHRRRLSAPFFARNPDAYKDTEVEPEDHHGDFGRVYGYNGDIYSAHLTSSAIGGTAAKSLIPRKIIDATTYPRVSRDAAHYQTEIHGQKYTLLWGDLHKHSNISRCSTGNEPSPDDHYKYAHDVCQYDFLCMSDHAEHTTDFNWWRIQKLADLYNVPGFFSVLYGYEWTAGWPVGHHNVIWAEKPAAILRHSLEGTHTIEELWSTLDKIGRPALTIPHTSADPGMGTRFDVHNDKYERLIEMFQACRGSYEYDGCPRQHVNATAKNCYVQDGLAKDYRMGFICSSDHGWGTAYAVVYGTENSRKAAFQGLQDRRCYASTTYGLVLDCRMGDHFMGEEFSLDKPAEISVFARGTAPIRQIEIFSDRKIVYSEGSVRKPINKNEARITWTPPLPEIGKSAYYYVRVIQGDDEIAWSSPFWVSSSKEMKTSSK
ncbi:MAG: hypothetical protein JWO95_2402, partial [Verrucomicrobiales bacterium]|nr:hypothetical protein [Verrucomicrobiales bacterium]